MWTSSLALRSWNPRLNCKRQQNALHSRLGRMFRSRYSTIANFTLDQQGGTPMLDCIITETKDIEPVLYDWGGVKWVANNDLDPGCEQSFGLVHILPGKTNPEHWHTAA